MSHVKNIAIVGAGGRIGQFIVSALASQGKHIVTAITRPDSTNSMPAGVNAIEKIDYASRETLVAALRGQDVLIISMSVVAPEDSQTGLIDAAIEAGVKYIVPNEYGVDHDNEALANDVLLGPRQVGIRQYIEKVSEGKTFWIAISCSFWYEFSLAGTEARYGFDFPNKKLTLIDDGNQKLSTTTWPQVGRAVAALFALPISTTELGTPSLSQFHNRALFITSFDLSQRDMLASVLRVTGDKEEDWIITTEEAHARYERGQKMYSGGDFIGFGILMYTRAFYAEDPAIIAEEKRQNVLLGLPEEDLDEATQVAVEMAKKEAAFAAVGR